MRRRSGLVFALAVALVAVPTARAAPGELDPSFGGGWTRVLEVRSATNNYMPRGAEGLAVQPDRKVLAAGDIQDGMSNHYLGVSRLLPNGQLDASFGIGGVAFTDIGAFEHAHAVALQRDAKIVVAGESDCQLRICMAVARFNADGTLDPSFGSGGVAQGGCGVSPSWALDVAVQPDGRIVAGGMLNRGGDAQDALLGCVVRLLPNGRVDGRFGRGGAVRVDHGYGNDDVRALVLQPHGKIVLAGQGTGNAIAVTRLRRNGALDRGFGRRGRRLIRFRGRSGTATALARGPGGRLVVAGAAGSGLNRPYLDRPPELVVACLTANGALLRGFGRDGRVITALRPFGGYASAVAVQRDARVVVVGRAFRGPERDGSDWGLVRYTPSGALDRSFRGGVVRGDFSTGADEARAVAWSGNQLMVGGAIGESLGLARYRMD